MGRIRRSFARVRATGAGEAILLTVALIAFLAQRAAITRLDHDGFAGDARRAIFFFTTAIVVVLAFGFRRYAGAWLIALGIALNFAPMATHGGLMPVAYETVAESGAFPQITEASVGHQLDNSKDVVLYRKDIALEWLTDRFVVTLPAYGTNVYSLGDFVVFVGTGAAAVQIAGGLLWPRRGPRASEARTAVRG